MRLVEQPMPQSYHLQDNDWTPLSQNPCWHRRYSPWPMFVYNDNLRVNIICKKNFYVGQVKSFVDDLNETGYCKHESSLCATICWGSALVSAICARTHHYYMYIVRLLLLLFLPFLLPPSKTKQNVFTPTWTTNIRKHNNSPPCIDLSIEATLSSWGRVE